MEGRRNSATKASAIVGAGAGAGAGAAAGADGAADALQIPAHSRSSSAGSTEDCPELLLPLKIHDELFANGAGR